MKHRLWSSVVVIGGGSHSRHRGTPEFLLRLASQTYALKLHRVTALKRDRWVDSFLQGRTTAVAVIEQRGDDPVLDDSAAPRGPRMTVGLSTDVAVMLI